LIIWITGLSASGKTTLGKAIQEKFKKRFFILIDGDIIRNVFLNDLGFAEKDRFKQITRMQNIALLLNKQKINVVVAALYSHPNLLKRNKMIFKNYLEIYLKADIDFLITREIKDIYLKAKKNKIKNVVGIDIKWNEPSKPDIVFEQRLNIPVKTMLKIIKKKAQVD
jgi:adenylylsulfate kinase-like enzyme